MPNAWQKQRIIQLLDFSYGLLYKTLELTISTSSREKFPTESRAAARHKRVVQPAPQGINPDFKLCNKLQRLFAFSFSKKFLTSEWCIYIHSGVKILGSQVAMDTLITHKLVPSYVFPVLNERSFVIVGILFFIS